MQEPKIGTDTQPKIEEKKQSRYDIEERKQQVLEKLDGLCHKYNLVRNGRPQTITLAELLVAEPCERKIKFGLEQGRLDFEEGKRFDPIFKSKSDLACTFLIGKIKSKLAKEGYNADIATEQRDLYGIYDLVIRNSNPIKLVSGDTEKIRVEVKASGGLPLSQLTRYFLDSSTLILVRVITNHVILIHPTDLEQFVKFSLDQIDAKADRLESGSFLETPGLYCSYGCPDYGCKYNKSKIRKAVGMVKLTNDDFEQDLLSYFSNLASVAERCADMVVEELRRSR